MVWGVIVLLDIIENAGWVGNNDREKMEEHASVCTSESMDWLCPFLWNVFLPRMGMGQKTRLDGVGRMRMHRYPNDEVH